VMQGLRTLLEGGIRVVSGSARASREGTDDDAPSSRVTHFVDEISLDALARFSPAPNVRRSRPRRFAPRNSSRRRSRTICRPSSTPKSVSRASASSRHERCRGDLERLHRERQLLKKQLPGSFGFKHRRYASPTAFTTSRRTRRDLAYSGRHVAEIMLGTAPPANASPG